MIKESLLLSESVDELATLCESIHKLEELVKKSEDLSANASRRKRIERYVRYSKGLVEQINELLNNQ